MTPQDHTAEYQLIQQRVDHERELREETAKQLKLALDLQAKEYERRLDDLNGAHKRTAEERGMFVKGEIFSIHCTTMDKWCDDHLIEQNLWRAEHIKENDDWKLEVSNTLAASKARDEASRKSWTIVTVAISLALNAAALILAFLIHSSRATP